MVNKKYNTPEEKRNARNGYVKKWRLTHREKWLAYKKQWNILHKEENKISYRKWKLKVSVAKKCKFCGKEFKAFKKAKFCSKQCFQDWFKKVVGETHNSKKETV